MGSGLAGVGFTGTWTVGSAGVGVGCGAGSAGFTGSTTMGSTVTGCTLTGCPVLDGGACWVLGTTCGSTWLVDALPAGWAAWGLG